MDVRGSSLLGTAGAMHGEQSGTRSRQRNSNNGSEKMPLRSIGKPN